MSLLKSDLDNVKLIKKLFLGGHCGVWLCYIAANRSLFDEGFYNRFMETIKLEFDKKRINTDSDNWKQRKLWEAKDLKSREDYLDKLIKELQK